VSSEIDLSPTGVMELWLPGILINVVKQCVARKVFKDNAAMMRTVEKVTDLNDFLR